jgi:hypothetical protein
LESANEEPEDTKQKNVMFLSKEREIILDNLDRRINILGGFEPRSSEILKF